MTSPTALTSRIVTIAAEAYQVVNAMSLSAEARYQKQWKIDRARGVKRMGPANKARAHIESLAMAGASYRAIADAAGLSVQAVCRLRDGQSTAKVTTLRAVLAVAFEDTLNRSGREDFVLNLGAKRRLQALMRIGHSAETIGSAVGKNRSWVYNTINQQGRWVSRERHDLARTAYDTLSMIPGSSGKTTTLAETKGWVPPLAWDDEAIDDPYADPDLGADIVLIGPGDKVHLEDIEDCIDWGLNRVQAARRLGVDKSAIEHRCERTGRADLLAGLDRNKARADLRLTVGRAS